MDANTFIIHETVNDYFNERRDVLKHISNLYNRCTDMPTRRFLREEKVKIIKILDMNVSYAKMIVMQSTTIPFNKIDNYPELIRIAHQINHINNVCYGKTEKTNRKNSK